VWCWWLFPHVWEEAVVSLVLSHLETHCSTFVLESLGWTFFGRCRCHSVGLWCVMFCRKLGFCFLFPPFFLSYRGWCFAGSIHPGSSSIGFRWLVFIVVRYVFKNNRVCVGFGCEINKYQNVVLSYNNLQLDICAKLIDFENVTL
jgi:hypothetical protein